MPAKQKDVKLKKKRAPRKPTVASKQKQIKQLVNVSVQSSGGSGGGGSSVPTFVPQSFKQGSGVGEDVRFESLVNKLINKFGDVNKQQSSSPVVENPNPILYQRPDLSGLSLADKVALESTKQPLDLGLDIDEEGISIQKNRFNDLKEAEDESINAIEATPYNPLTKKEIQQHQANAPKASERNPIYGKNSNGKARRGPTLEQARLHLETGVWM